MATSRLSTRRVEWRVQVGTSNKPGQGLVIFEASVSYIPDPQAAGGPRTAIPEPVSAVLDSGGYVCTPDATNPAKAGERGVDLFTTDSLGEDGGDWTWTARPQLRSVNGIQMTNAVPAFSFTVPTGAGSLDLAEVQKVPASPGLGTEAAVALVARAEKAASTALTAVEANVKDTAIAAVARELSSAGIMRGYASSPVQQAGSAWRQTTEDGQMLPLGYKPNGHLDDFAVKVWKEDTLNAVEVPAHPVYARAVVTEGENKLLWGIRWNGTVDIPGLSLPVAIPPTVPALPPSRSPAVVNPLSWSMWGSSSAEGIAPELQAAAARYGANYTDGGKGGEWSFQIAARLGSVPARLTFPENTIPASGTVAVSTSIDTNASFLKAFTGHVETTSGATVVGSLAYSGGGLKFTRSASGAAESVAPQSPFIPDLGTAARADTMFLWMGKGNAGEVERVIYETNASYDYLAPLVKRCLVLGHFVNTGKTAGDTGRAKIQAINSAYAARYGSTYVDISAYLTGSQVWADSGITPTAEDLAEQKLGNKPPSLSMDAGHLNNIGDGAVVGLLIRRMESLGWLSAAPA